MEDKIIRAKIDSLHTLPEGYAPSLDSKWELLQAGLKGKKERSPLYWIAIAAGVLLLLGLGWVMMQSNVKNEAPAIVHAEEKNENTPIVEQPLERTVPAEAATASNENKKPLDKRSFVVAPQKKELPEEIKIESENTVTANETLFVKPVTAIAKSTAKPKKKKYVEMEFSDPPQHQPSMEAQADPRFRIRLMPQQEHSTQGSSESASIKLKKSF